MNLSELMTDIKDKKIMSEGVQIRDGRYYPTTMQGKPIGLKTGYSTMKEAVRAFYNNVLTTFKYLDPERQDTLVNNYMKKRALGKN